MTAKPTMNVVRLQKMVAEVYAKIDLAMLNLVDHEVQAQIIQGEYQMALLSLSAYVWGEELETKTFKYPVNWWQAVRARWLPQWWLKKHPVKLHTIECSARALYPGMKTKVPGQELKIAVTVSEWWRE